jgi:hypothetical protein
MNAGSFLKNSRKKRNFAIDINSQAMPSLQMEDWAS